METKKEPTELYELKEQFGSMSSMRRASHRDNPDYNELARYAVAALDKAFGTAGRTVDDCLGLHHDIKALLEYTAGLLASGELRYELVEHCMSELTMWQTTVDGEFEPFDFTYTMPCRGWADGTTSPWRSGISPAVFVRAQIRVERDDEDNGIAFAPRSARDITLPVSPIVSTSAKEGASVEFAVRVSWFASVLSRKDYDELVSAARKFDAAPRVHCTALVFDDAGMRKVCRKRLELTLAGDSEDAVFAAAAQSTFTGPAHEVGREPDVYKVFGVKPSGNDTSTCTRSLPTCL